MAGRECTYEVLLKKTGAVIKIHQNEVKVIARAKVTSIMGIPVVDMAGFRIIRRQELQNVGFKKRPDLRRKTL